MQHSVLVCLLVCSVLTPHVIGVSAKNQKGSKCERSIDVAIIGAGPAGSYFAYRLRDAGLNIELFEYSDRIGGRLFTATLPNIPDVHLELGGMRYIDKAHVRFHQLVQELDLTPIEFTEGFGSPDRMKYFLRGKTLTADEVSHGEVPYNLSLEEKAHQSNLAGYYLEKLTGFNGSALTEEIALKLKTKDGRDFYKLTVKEAIGMVATSEGRNFFTGKDPMTGSAFSEDISSADFFLYQLPPTQPDMRILTLKEGFSAFPQSLVNTFLKSSNRNKLTLNRKLKAITQKDSSDYVLRFTKTTTTDGITVEERSTEFVCAKKVVLAIPQFALTRLKWIKLRSPKVRDALFAVIPIKVSKVFLAFPTAWWLSVKERSSYVVLADAPFSQMYDWKSSNVSRDYVLLASYAEGKVTEYQQRLNSKGKLAPGSAAGANKVTNRLKKKLLHHLEQAFGVDAKTVPETTAAISQFWTSYPYGGGWAIYRPGYNFTAVRQSIQRPSSTDEVYIVGSDLSFPGMSGWAESALATVDLVYDKYFM